MAETSTTRFELILGADTANGGGGNGGGGNGLMSKVFSKGNKDIKNELEKGNKGDKKGLGATLGIKFGVASLLKQSQVFTGFVGTIFQLMGALVDVILAPFLPILIPGIRFIADMIPIVAKYAQAIYDFIDRTIFQWFRNLGWSVGVGDAVKKALSAILVGVVMLKVTGMFNLFRSLVGNFFVKPLWAAAKFFFNLKLWDTLKLKAMMLQDTIIAGAKAALRGAWDATGGKIVTGVKNAWQAVVKGTWDDGAQPFLKGIKTSLGTFIGDGLSGLRTNFIDPLFSKIAGVADFFISPFKNLWKAIAGDVVTAGDNMFIRVLNVVKEMPFVKAILALGTLPAHLTRLFDWLPTMIKNVVKGLPVVDAILQFIKKKIGGFLSGALKLAKGGLGKAVGLGDAGRALLGKAPGSGMISGMGKNLSPSALKRIAQGFKAIPILGAVAELGFGGWQTYKDYKKYGAKAALGRAGLTLANTTAALFDPTGLASAGASIASNIAMDQAYKRMLDPKDEWKEKSELWIKIKDDFGVESWEKQDKNKTDNEVNGSLGQPKDRTSLDGIF